MAGAAPDGLGAGGNEAGDHLLPAPPGQDDGQDTQESSHLCRRRLEGHIGHLVRYNMLYVTGTRHILFILFIMARNNNL